MSARHLPLPRLWLVTDERQGDRLLSAVRALPRGAAILFRHFATPDRAALLALVRHAARRRGVRVLVACENGRSWSAAGDGLQVAVVHDAREMLVARLRRPTLDAIMISPVFATRTHPGASALGPTRFAALARRSPVPVIALGGMDGQRWRRLRPFGAHGWAGIDGLTSPG